MSEIDESLIAPKGGPSWEVLPLDGCRAKITHAIELIGEIRTSTHQWLILDGPSEYEVVSTPAPGGTEWLLRLPEIPRPPLRIASLFSDALHNLRSCLDHLVVSLVQANGGDPTNVQFPYCRTESAWKDALKRGLGGAAPAAVQIIREYQPVVGYELLDVIRVASNADKHNYFFPINIGFRPETETPPRLTFPDDPSPTMTRLFDYMTPIKPGQSLYKIVTSSGSGPEMGELHAHIKVGFGQTKNGSLGLEILDLLHLTEEVADLVSRFKHEPDA